MRSKEIVVGVADQNTPEITLKLDTPLKGKPEIGEEIEFEGVPSAFQPDPFMITFDVETAKIKGLTVKPAGHRWCTGAKEASGWEEEGLIQSTQVLVSAKMKQALGLYATLRI